MLFIKVGVVGAEIDWKGLLPGYLLTGAVNSVGLECHLDRVEVTGSSPVQPTFFSLEGFAVCALHSLVCNNLNAVKYSFISGLIHLRPDN